MEEDPRSPARPGDRGGEAGDAVLAFVGADGRVAAWSAQAERLLGVGAREAVGRPVTEVLLPDLPERARRRMARGDGWSGRVTLRPRAGPAVAAGVRLAPVRDGSGRTGWTVLRSGGARGGEAADVLSGWALDQLPFSVGVYDEDARLAWGNRIGTRLMGVPLDDAVGRRLDEVAAGDAVFARLQRDIERALRTGEPSVRSEFHRAPAEERAHAWSVRFVPLRDGAGVPRGVAVTGIDVTQEYQARQRLSVVNEAGARIGTTLDVSRTASELAEVAVERFADFVGVDLLDSVMRPEEPDTGGPGGSVLVHRVAQASSLPGVPESVVRTGLTDRYHRGSPMARALLTGEPSLRAVGDPVIRRWLAREPGRAGSWADFGMHSVITVPLRARGATLGVAVYLRHRTGQLFDADDLLLARELTARAAVCVDNALRYTRQRETALELQRSLLPRDTPRQAAVEATARYLPAGSRRGVGGDWFDVIPLSGARVALVVGDVVGHGVRASATMGRLRTAVRTLADIDVPPDELLTHLDDIVLRLDREEGEGQGAGGGGEVGATCLYAVYDPASGVCTLARAGHLAPAVVSPDGTVVFPELPAGPPLGLGGLPFESADLRLAEGSRLVMFTDGLVETREHDVDHGVERLRRALSRVRPGLEETCDEVLEALLPGGGVPADDVALLVARTRVLGPAHVATWELPGDPEVVARARRLATGQLAAWGLEDAAYVTELVVSELVTNAVRYAGGPLRLRLIRDETLICEVADASGSTPHMRRARVYDEGGRGLLLVARLTERWGTRHTPGGKVIWAEQDLVAV